MNFIIGLIDTIRKGQELARVNNDGSRSINGKAIFNISLGFPIFIFFLGTIFSTQELTFMYIIVSFFECYFFLFIVSLLCRFIGISYLGTYKYIFNYIFKRSR